MRAGIALLSILIAVGVIMYISFGGKNGGYEGQVLNQGRAARRETNQLAGHDHPEQSIVLDDDMVGNELRGLKVTGVTAGGVMESVYGVKVGDEIIEANQLQLRGSDSGTAKAMVIEGYGRNQDLIVRRSDQDMTLKPKNTPLSKLNPSLLPKSIPTH